MGTAANYVVAIRWACKAHGLSSDWDTERIGMLIKGSRKIELERVGATLEVGSLLTTKIAQEVVDLANTNPKLAVLPPFLLSGWAFLMRIQSECIPLEWGTPEELVTVPEGRHSAVCVIGGKKPVLAIRWRRRKHRPAGSLLKRPCTCKDGQGQSPYCVVHRVQQWVQACNIKTGQKLWEHEPGKVATGSQMLSKLKRCLILLGYQEASLYSWKSVRAGKATEMAAQGFTLGQVLAAGEWRSSAYMNYIDETGSDHAQLLRAALAESDADE